MFLKNSNSFWFSISFFLLSFCFSNAWSQYSPKKFTNGIVPEITPVSTEAQSLGKYGNWPVSLYTGTPNISVPIFDIKVSEFTLPIQLSYHTGGLKVDDIASWAGSGWSLNAGGAITRSIVGLADEGPNGFLTRNKAFNYLQSSYNLGSQTDYVRLLKAADLMEDTEPDMFYYNFAGHSGKFFFDQQGNFRAVPANSLKLLASPLSNTTDNHWEIADQQGNVFYFGSPDYAGNGNEKTKTVHGLSTRQEQLTAWYLTKVILKNNADIIYLDYVEKTESYVSPPVYSYRIKTSGNQLDACSSAPEVLRTNALYKNGEPISSSSTETVVNTFGKSMLDKIRWRGGEINFSALLTRGDITGKNLTSITVFNNLEQKVKDFRFTYYYINQRYFLESLAEFGTDNLKKSSHDFEYENPAGLPLRHSNAQDHWGYYNGANGNTHLLPPVPELNQPYLNANREPSESSMKFGSLKRIKYPTGGHTNFVYQANRYDPSTVPGGGNPGGTIVSLSKVVQAADPQPGTFQQTETFTIPFTQNTADIKIEFRNYIKPAGKNDTWIPLIRIDKLVNGVYQQVYYWDAFDEFPGNPQLNSNGSVDFDKLQSLNFDPGDYRIIANLYCASGCNTPAGPSVKAYLNYKGYSTSGNPGELMAGGLRIGEIYNETENGVVGRQKYTYTPGRLMLYPTYLHEYGEEIYKTSCEYNTEYRVLCHTVFNTYREAISSGQTILGVTQGSPVGYTQVKESAIAANGVENGFTEYTYSFTPDVLSQLQLDNSYWTNTNILSKAVPVTNFDYKRGLLIGKVVYRLSNGTPSKISELENVYEFNDFNATKGYNSLRAMRVKRMRTVTYPCGSSYEGYILPAEGFSPDFAYAYYDVITGWVQTKSVTETMYDMNGQNPVTTTTVQYYDNPLHLQLTKSESSTSDGVNVIRSFLYPHEMVSQGLDGTGIFAKMIAKNQIGSVIEEKVSKNGKSQSTLTVYKDWYNNTQVIQPEYVNSQTNIDLPETRFRFHGYDLKGNLLTASQERGKKSSYKWGYNELYPIARVDGASVNQFYHENFEEVNDFDGSVVLDNTRSHTGKFSGKMVNAGSSELVSHSSQWKEISQTGPRKFKFSGWVYSEGPSAQLHLFMRKLNETNYYTYVDDLFFGAASKWVFHEKEFTVPADVHTVNLRIDNNGGGTVWFDDLKFHPSPGQMTTYTYQPLVGMTSQIDPRGETTYYEYDSFQRLSLVRDQHRNIIKTYCYNYAGQLTDCSSSLAIPAPEEVPLPCSPSSPLPCSAMELSLPVNLSFNQAVPNTIADNNSQGLGFTMVQAYSGTRLAVDGSVSNGDVPGYEASKLTLNSSGQLQIMSNKGIAYLTNNNQLNALGVQFNSQNNLKVETVLINPFYGTSAQQAGIWMGQNDGTFLKLVVVGNKLEFRKEVNNASLTADMRETAVISGLNTQTVTLRIEINQATQMAEAFYSVDGITFTNVGAGYPVSGLSISGMGLTGGTTFAGIFATHRSSSTPVTYTFDNFSIADLAPALPCFPSSTLPCSALEVSLPLSLNFNQSMPNTIAAQNSQGTGFTLVNNYSGTRLSADGTPENSDVPAYQPSRLTLTGGQLQILSNKGISYLTNNNQLNALGVKFNSQSKYQVETVVINPFNGTSAQQAGIWVGQNDQSFLKLVVVGNKVEFRREVNDVSGSGTADILVTAVISGLDAQAVRLRIIVDPATSIAEGYYSTDGITYTKVGTTGFDVSGMGVTGATTSAGIFATHRSSSTAVTYSFDSFNIAPVN